jgi:RNA-directed DNA polymerase
MEGRGTSSSPDAIDPGACAPRDGWNTLPWKQFQRHVFKLQQRIYHASCRGDVRTVRKLQRLLIHSRSARCLAVRKVTQENQGKKTAGVDGVKSLTPPQRLVLVYSLRLGQPVQPVRRVWIPKPGTTEQRPLGIPVMADRALQSLVKAALEPEWEARFEPNSYGFRPGRSCQDAIEAIFTALGHKAKYVLDADIAKCFDRINHSALLAKVHTSPSLRRQLKAWLKAGVLDNGQLFPTTEGTMQGGNISPLLANVALHGLETVIRERFPRSGSRGFNSPNVIRYGDDFVVLHEDRHVVQQGQDLASAWLKPMGLELQPSKTRITHTLAVSEGTPGFDFLGFHIRQYPAGKTKSGKDCRGRLQGFKTRITPSKVAIHRHVHDLHEIVHRHRHAEQSTLIQRLNPVIIGWTQYYAHVASARVFAKVHNVLYAMLCAWAVYRHPNKKKRWTTSKYWRVDEGKGWVFQPPHSSLGVYPHYRTPIRRYVKVQGSRSPYDGDWVYWSVRLGRHPEISSRVARLLRTQQGKCPACGLFFMEGDRMEIDHIRPQACGGSDAMANLQLLHQQCHERKTANDLRCSGPCDKRHVVEEPDEAKASRPVLEPSRNGDIPA